MGFLRTLVFCCLLLAAAPALAEDKPADDNAPLRAWAEKAATQAYSYSFLTFDSDMVEISHNFTAAGWKDFTADMQKNHVAEDVQKMHELVTAIAIKPPLVVRPDVLQMTVAIEHQSGADMRTEYKILQIAVEETPVAEHPSGYAIAALTSTDAPPPAETTITTITKTRDAPARLCGEVGKMQKMLMQQRHLAFLATSIDSKEVVHIYFRSNIDGRWAEMEMDDNLQACIVREGYDFHFMMGNRSLAAPEK